MKRYKWIYGALSVASTIILGISLFVPGIEPLVQTTFLVGAVGYGCLCGVAIGGEL